MKKRKQKNHLDSALFWGMDYSLGPGSLFAAYVYINSQLWRHDGLWPIRHQLKNGLGNKIRSGDWC